MTVLAYLEVSPLALVISTFLLGLVVGSFLNVVIHRLPVMLRRDWEAQCAELAGNPVPEIEPYNLVHPGSTCPHCGHRIGALENIPLVSYVALRGRCRQCGARISLRYPLVELACGLLSAAVAWHFGFGWPALAALMLTWALIALAGIDLGHQLLPDNITLSFLWLGLLLSLAGMFTDIRSAVIGGAAGYLALWSVYQLFRLVTGKEGMGYGDFKLLAMLGAWLGWQQLPAIILLSSAVGAIVGGLLIVLRRHSRQVPIPFGPYLAAAGWIALLWGNDLTRAYLQYAGVH